jgi:hypothetical protein
MRAALDAHRPGERPDEARVVEMLGPLQAPPARTPDATSPREGRRSRRP